ncbi:MAG TPA: STAS domain-containing protein [Acidobacteriota bacterium]|nr:STAS domain-containing protein [Acidobacteriota bacterium]
MDVSFRENEGVIVVDMQGRLVSGGPSESLRQLINQLLVEDRDRVLLNLSEVGWIDSSGIGELVSGIKRAEASGCSVKLLRVGDRVRHVLSISRLLPLLEVYEDEDEAIESFDQSSEE